MPIWDKLIRGFNTASSASPLPLSPFIEQSDALQTITVAQLWPEHETTPVLDREAALKIPSVKRAHDIVCGVLARMPWRAYDNDVELTDQPRWLTNTKTGIAPRHLRWGVVSDLFMSGWALIGFELGADKLPVDALHIPRQFWDIDATGKIELNVDIDARYRHLLVPINIGYGSNGMLADAIDAMRDARTIQRAYRDRIDNPIAQTVLTLAAAYWDGWTREEREQFRQDWMRNRSTAGGATAMKPDFVTVDYPTAIPSDLFESGRNAARLDIANHAGLPADLLEGSKQGSAGAMTYSNETSTRNELWDFGLAKYADAIEARLSLDDVCAPGHSIRIDTRDYLSSPTPTDPPTSED